MGHICQSVATPLTPANNCCVHQEDVHDPHKAYQSGQGNFLHDKLMIKNSSASHETIIKHLKKWQSDMAEEPDAMVRQYLQNMLSKQVDEINGEISLMKYKRERSIEDLTFEYQNYDSFMQSLVTVWHSNGTRVTDQQFVKLTVQTVDYILNPAVTIKNDEVLKNFLAIMMASLEKQKYLFEEVQTKIKQLRQCYDFEPNVSHSYGAGTANQGQVENFELSNTIHQYFEGEKAKINRYKVWYHQRGSSQNITSFLKKNWQRIENQDYQDSPFQLLPLKSMPNQLPRLDQLVFFQREIMKLSSDTRNMMGGNLIQQAWFLVQYYHEHSWKFIATFSVFLKDKKLSYNAKLNKNISEIMKTIKKSQVEDQSSSDFTTEIQTPFRVYDMLTFEVNVSDPIQVIQIFEQIQNKQPQEFTIVKIGLSTVNQQKQIKLHMIYQNRIIGMVQFNYGPPQNFTQNVEQLFDDLQQANDVKEFKALMLEYITNLAAKNQIYDSQYEFEQWKKRYQELIQKDDSQNQIQDLIAQKVKEEYNKQLEHQDQITVEQIDHDSFKSPNRKSNKTRLKAGTPDMAIPKLKMGKLGLDSVQLAPVLEQSSQGELSDMDLSNLSRQKKNNEREERVRKALEKMNYSGGNPIMQQTLMGGGKSGGTKGTFFGTKNDSDRDFEGEQDDMLLRLKQSTAEKFKQIISSAQIEYHTQHPQAASQLIAKQTNSIMTKEDSQEHQQVCASGNHQFILITSKQKNPYANQSREILCDLCSYPIDISQNFYHCLTRENFNLHEHCHDVQTAGNQGIRNWVNNAQNRINHDQSYSFNDEESKGEQQECNPDDHDPKHLVKMTTSPYEEEKFLCDVCKNRKKLIVATDGFYHCTKCNDYDVCQECHKKARPGASPSAAIGDGVAQAGRGTTSFKRATGDSKGQEVRHRSAQESPNTQERKRNNYQQEISQLSPIVSRATTPSKQCKHDGPNDLERRTNNAQYSKKCGNCKQARIHVGQNYYHCIKCNLYIQCENCFQRQSLMK